MTRHLLVLGLLAIPLAAASNEPLDAPPPLEPLESGEALEPEVTIWRTERATVYEYRRNGALFMVRVLPVTGPPYFFVDVDGDGSLDFRPGDPHAIDVNQWLLYRW